MPHQINFSQIFSDSENKHAYPTFLLLLFHFSLFFSLSPNLEDQYKFLKITCGSKNYISSDLIFLPTDLKIFVYDIPFNQHWQRSNARHLKGCPNTKKLFFCNRNHKFWPITPISRFLSTPTRYYLIKMG